MAWTPLASGGRRFDSPLSLVQVRIAAVCDQRVGGIDHPLRQIDVGVDRADDRQLIPHSLAELTEPVAIGVPMLGTDGRPVRSHQDAIQRSRPFQLRKHPREQGLKCLGGNRSIRYCSRGEDRYGFQLLLFESGEKTSNFVVGIGHFLPDRCARQQKILLKIGQRRRF